MNKGQIAHNFIDMAGQKFGRLTILGSYEKRKSTILWKCICDCGKEKFIAGIHLRNGHTKSCGCLSKEMMSGENNVAKLQKVREKISKAKRGKPQPNVSKAKTGYKNPAWKKELSQEERLKNKSRLTEDIGYRNFKILVAIRDKNTCVKCGYKSGRNMRVHHLNSYKDDIQNRTNPDNAVLLCNKCHDINFAGSFHNNYGRGNNTKEQFNEYMQEINTFEEDVKGVTI